MTAHQGEAFHGRDTCLQREALRMCVRVLQQTERARWRAPTHRYDRRYLVADLPGGMRQQEETTMTTLKAIPNARGIYSPEEWPAGVAVTKYHFSVCSEPDGGGNIMHRYCGYRVYIPSKGIAWECTCSCHDGGFLEGSRGT